MLPLSFLTVIIHYRNQSIRAIIRAKRRSTREWFQKVEHNFVFPFLSKNYSFLKVNMNNSTIPFVNKKSLFLLEPMSTGKQSPQKMNKFSRLKQIPIQISSPAKKQSHKQVFTTPSPFKKDVDYSFFYLTKDFPSPVETPPDNWLKAVEHVAYNYLEQKQSCKKKRVAVDSGQSLFSHHSPFTTVMREQE